MQDMDEFYPYWFYWIFQYIPNKQIMQILITICKNTVLSEIIKTCCGKKSNTQVIAMRKKPITLVF
jgi:hypothetical protein